MYLHLPAASSCSFPCKSTMMAQIIDWFNDDFTIRPVVLTDAVLRACSFFLVLGIYTQSSPLGDCKNIQPCWSGSKASGILPYLQGTLDFTTAWKPRCLYYVLHVQRSLWGGLTVRFLENTHNKNITHTSWFPKHVCWTPSKCNAEAQMSIKTKCWQEYLSSKQT